MPRIVRIRSQGHHSRAAGLRYTSVMIRPATPRDHAGMRDVCLRTSDGGQDASTLYADPGIVPAVFLNPYLEFEPELAFVVDDGEGGVGGYIVGTADTERFVRLFRDAWLPRVAARYPMPEGEPQTADERLARLLHSPEWMHFADLAHLPAHLHIDLLPSHQGQGLGRALVERFVAALVAQGVAGLHVDVSLENPGSQRFFERLGFERIDDDSPIRVVHFGLSL
jgi:ribosomal protein S18 acetylase RimI-like enzyme